MKRILSILNHPFAYYCIKKDQEQMLMLCYACNVLGIEKPDVWNVDTIKDAINAALLTFYLDKNFLDESSDLLKKSLFWTLLISRFKRIEFTREDVKNLLDRYQMVANATRKDDPNIDDITAIYSCLVSKFHLFM